MDYREIYEQWLANPYFDEATKEELKGISEDENEIKERFYMDLEFGTAGLRGIIGAGTNRMNIYVVRRATQGLANYYYVHKKTLVSRKNTEKLQNLVRQKENWEYFIRKCFGSYPF